MRTARTVAMLVASLATAALVGSGGASSASPTGTTGGKWPGFNIDALRVDRVPTPKPDWFDCSPAFGDGAECTSVDLPLDYDEPRGATTSVAVLRLRATDQAHKIGTLFVNPGGPGGSGVDFASAAPYFLGADVLERFDIVGFDPRGVGYSDNVRCWKNMGTQAKDLTGFDSVAFPFTKDEEAAYVKASKAFGTACASTGQPLAGSMSTAEVARDMDVLRRMVGDKKLSYLGFSYGTYLGNVYANMFPDRVRAVAIDGVLDPLAWQGTPATSTVPQTARLKSGDGAAKALNEILERCGTAGPEYCGFAAYGDPAASYASLVAALKKAPAEITDPETGEVWFTVDYATLISLLLGDLYSADAAAIVDIDLSAIRDLLQPVAPPNSVMGAKQSAARTALAPKALAAQRQSTTADALAARKSVRGFGFPYNNAYETFQSVLCTDGSNPASADRWPGYADRADQTGPGFGRLWTWASAPCASKTWTVRDEDAYWGAFNHRTTNPVLVVGNYWDPATNYDGAVTAASLLPNSRLLSSDSWGHTAYGTSACVTDAVDGYLVTLQTPAKGTVCVGDSQPFTTPLEEPEPSQTLAPSAGSRARSSSADKPKQLPPVVPPLPGATPRY